MEEDAEDEGVKTGRDFSKREELQSGEAGEDCNKNLLVDISCNLRNEEDIWVHLSQSRHQCYIVGKRLRRVAE